MTTAPHHPARPDAPDPLPGRRWAGRRWAGWHPGTWLLLGCCVLVGLVAVGYGTVMVWFGDSTTCSDPPTAAQVWHGQRDLLVLVVVAAAPWTVAVLRSRRRVRLVAAALVCLSPALLALVLGLDPESWRGGFCF